MIQSYNKDHHPPCPKVFSSPLSALRSDKKKKKIMNIHTPSQDSVSILLSLLGYVDAFALAKATKLS